MSSEYNSQNSQQNSAPTASLDLHPLISEYNPPCAVILAAGQGKRMKSQKPKALAEVLFKPMIRWVIDAAVKSGITNICVVTGYKKEILENYLKTLPFFCNVAHQAEMLGTADAVISATKFLKDSNSKDVLILGGDSPFLDYKTIKNAYELHTKQQNSATVISAKVSNPFGYGRIIKDSQGHLLGIVEHKDADNQTLAVNEINAGAYWFDINDLLAILPLIKSQNLQCEYYLPDTITLLLKQNKRAGSFTSNDGTIALGANDCLQLHNLNKIAKDKIINKWLCFGIDIPFEDGVIIGPDVVIGEGSTILPGTIIIGKKIIPKNTIVGREIHSFL